VTVLAQLLMACPAVLVQTPSSRAMPRGCASPSMILQHLEHGLGGALISGTLASFVARAGRAAFAVASPHGESTGPLFRFWYSHAQHSGPAL